MVIGEKVRSYIAQKYGTQAKAAKAWGVSGAMVSQVVRGGKVPPKYILDEMGLERRVIYVPKGEE